MTIKILKSEKKIAKTIIKDLASITKNNKRINLGLYDENKLNFLYDSLSASKKIKWNDVNIFSTTEYLKRDDISLSKIIKEKFANVLSKYSTSSFVSLKNEIKQMLESNDLESLFSSSIIIDVLLIYVDHRGNFLLNDFESELGKINISSNGDEIIGPGIRTILQSKQVLLVALDQDGKEVIENLITKKISEDNPYSLLSLHPNLIFYTLKSLADKKMIGNNFDQQIFNKLQNKYIYEDSPSNEEQPFEGDNLVSEENNLFGEEVINDDAEPKYVDSENEIEYDTIEELAVEDTLFDETFEEEVNQELIEEFTPEEMDEEINNQDEIELLEQEEIHVEDIIEEDVTLTNDDQDDFANTSDIRYPADDLEDNYEANYGISKSENFFIPADDLSSYEICYSQKETIVFEKPEEVIQTESDSAVEIDRVIEQYNGEYQVHNEVEEAHNEVEQVQSKEQPVLNHSESQEKQGYQNQQTYRDDSFNLGTENLTKAQIRKIINIKMDSLKALEEIQKTYSTNPEKNETHVFKYIPGLRPTPMLMYYQDANEEVYESHKKEMYESLKINSDNEFTTSRKHIWNHGAYIIYDEVSLIVQSFVFTDLALLIYLLRALNSELFYLTKNKKMIEFMNKEKSNFNGEFVFFKK